MLTKRYEIEMIYFFIQDLIKDLKSELGGKLEDLVVALFKGTTYYDAWSLHKAMKVSKIYGFHSTFHELKYAVNCKIIIKLLTIWLQNSYLYVFWELWLHSFAIY